MQDEITFGTSFQSVADMWHHRIGSTPDAVAFRWREGSVWRTMTWQQAGKRVRAIGNGLLSLGLEPGFRCCLLANTSVAWMLCDLGILCSGQVATSIHVGTPTDEFRYILRDSDVRVVFCDTAARAERVLAEGSELSIERVVCFGKPRSSDPRIVSLDAFVQQGHNYGADHPHAYPEAYQAIGKDDLATVLYTSGTTAMPKGVALTHDAWIYEAEAIDALDVISPADLHYLFLPLSHVFARVLELTVVRLGVPSVVDGSIDDLMPNLVETQPTWMAVVPRVLEKAQSAIVAGAARRGRLHAKLLQWAMGVGRETLETKRAWLNPSLRIKQRIADKLVFRQIRAQFGGKLRFVISGGAPLDPEIASFFAAAGVLVLEGYGLTESAAASCVNRPDTARFGTVGPPLPGTKVRIATDGEIEIKSRGVMRGYIGDPEESQRVLTDDGWLRTGDLGTILPTGHVKITGRKKELIVTASGKNVGPAQFEGKLRARCPYVQHALLHGDKRNFCVAIITLEPKPIAAWAGQHNVQFSDLADLVTKPAVRDLIQGYVDSVNQTLQKHERVRRIALLGEPFTQDNGLLTASLKLKRSAIEARYAQLLDSFYVGTVVDFDG